MAKASFSIFRYLNSDRHLEGILKKMPGFERHTPSHASFDLETPRTDLSLEPTEDGTYRPDIFQFPETLVVTGNRLTTGYVANHNFTGLAWYTMEIFLKEIIENSDYPVEEMHMSYANTTGLNDVVLKGGNVTHSDLYFNMHRGFIDSATFRNLFDLGEDLRVRIDRYGNVSSKDMDRRHIPDSAYRVLDNQGRTRDLVRTQATLPVACRQLQ